VGLQQLWQQLGQRQLLGQWQQLRPMLKLQFKPSQLLTIIQLQLEQQLRLLELRLVD